MFRAPTSLTRVQMMGYLALCLIWGSTWFAMRVAVREIPPLKAAAVRFLIAAVLLLASLLFRKAKWPQGRRQWNAAMVLSLTVIAVPYGLLFWAEQYVSSSIGALLFSAMPLLVALMTPLMLGRTVPRNAVFAMLLGFGGLATLFWKGELTASALSLWGGLAVLSAVLMSAWSVVYAKTRLQDVDPVIATGLQSLFGCVVLYWGNWALESHRTTTWSRTSVIAILFLAVFGSAAALAIYYWLLKHMQPYQLSTLTLVVPIIAVVEGSLLGHEAVPLLMIAAMVVVLGSVGAVLLSDADAKGQDPIVLLAGDAE
jgi:drug/metabolite transporter (DMT)-like permease